MPPKPWQRQPTTAENSGEIVQAQANQDPDLASTRNIDPTNQAMTGTTPLETTADPTSTQAATTNPTTNPTSSMLGRSSYGGYGGGMGMGGMGMGGLGGMGMMGGMGMGGMGMGMRGMGMGGMGMYGNQGGEQSGFMQTLQMLDSMSFVVQSLCEVARTLECNAQGMSQLWLSLSSLVTKTRDVFVGSYKWVKKFIYGLVYKLMVKLRLAKEEIPKDKTETENFPEMEQTGEDKEIAEERKKLEALRKKKLVYNFVMKLSQIGFFLMVGLFFFKGRSIVKLMESGMQNQIEEKLKSQALAAPTGVANGPGNLPGGNGDAFENAFNGN